MPYEEALAARLRECLKRRKDTVEKKMFGGLAFLLNGNMCCGVLRDQLVVRMSPAAADKALMEPFVSRMDFTGRPMKGFLYVSREGITEDTELRRWVLKAVAFARSLPPKE